MMQTVIFCLFDQRAQGTLLYISSQILIGSFMHACCGYILGIKFVETELIVTPKQVRALRNPVLLLFLGSSNTSVEKNMIDRWLK